MVRKIAFKCCFHRLGHTWKDIDDVRYRDRRSLAASSGQTHTTSIQTLWLLSAALTALTSNAPLFCCLMGVSMWMFAVTARLSASISPELHVHLHQIVSFAQITYGRGSVLFWRRCGQLCTSDFMDDVMHPHNGQNTGDAILIKMRAQIGPIGNSTDMTTRRIVMVNYRGSMWHGAEFTQRDSDVISFHIYASWFSPPSCG